MAHNGTLHDTFSPFHPVPAPPPSPLWPWASAEYPSPVGCKVRQLFTTWVGQKHEDKRWKKWQNVPKQSKTYETEQFWTKHESSPWLPVVKQTTAKCLKGNCAFFDDSECTQRWPTSSFGALRPDKYRNWSRVALVQNGGPGSLR